jgi:CRISPR system Cascade subunit CasD
MDVLILRLRGPSMAFGDVAVDELRRTDVLPGLSFMTGLLGNALGWLYIHGDRLQALQDRLLLALRLERRGFLLRDYQNAQINRGDKVWRSTGGTFGRDMGAAGESIVQRERFYRADAAVTAALALEPPGESPCLDDLERVLYRPARPLFLGRMSCPPSGPIYRGERIQAGSLEDALRLTPPFPEKAWNASGKKAEESVWLEEYPAEDTAAASDARLHSNEFECKEPKFLKNKQDLIFQKLAGGGFAPAIPIRFLSKANWDGIVERHDLRDWRNGVHAGSRFVRRVLVEQEEKP